MRVLLTGATGFLGRVLVRRFADAGHTVAALVREPDAALGELGVEQIEGDVTSLDRMITAAAGCDAVVHTAARVAPLGRIEDYYDVNVAGTNHVLAACEYNDVRSLVYTSCAGVVIDRGDLNGVNERNGRPRARRRRIWRRRRSRSSTCLPRTARSSRPSRSARICSGDLASGACCRGSHRSRARASCAFSASPAARSIPATSTTRPTRISRRSTASRIEPGASIAGKAYFVDAGRAGTVDGFLNGLLRAAGFPAETRRVSPGIARLLASTASLRHALTGRDPLVTADSLALFGQSTWFNIAAARRELGYAPRVGMAEGFARRVGASRARADAGTLSETP